MKGLIVSCLCFIFVLGVMTFAEDKTITLQNGLENYSGCDDSYVYNKSSQGNGTKTTMSLQYRYQAGS